MAKDKESKKALLILVIISSALIFGLAFFAGYYYKDRISNLFTSRNQMQEEPEVIKDSPEITSNSQLPDDFPTDFPIYSNAELKDSWTAEGNATKGVSVIWETQDTATAIYEFYKEKLAEKSWEIVSEYQEDGSYTITFKKEAITGFVGVTKGEGDKTLISVTMGIGSQ